MALSFVSYPAAAAQTDFVVPFPYISKAHVLALVNGVSTPFTWTNAGVISMAARTLGDLVLVYRVTDISKLAVTWTDPSTVTASGLNTANLQQLYSLQESSELVLLGATTNGGWRGLTQAIVATTANITLSGEQTIDGVLTSLSRVLVKNQTLPQQNGPYTSGPAGWTRVVDADSASELGYSTMYILAGTVNAGSTFALPTAATDIVINTTPLNWVKVIVPNPVNVPQSTVSGAPTTGTWKAGDTTRDSFGVLYVCTVAGTPGTWAAQGSAVPVPNLLDNAGHAVDQRVTSLVPSSYTVAIPPLCTGVDRWWGNRRTNPGVYWTSGVVADAPSSVGTPNSLRVAITTASAIPATDVYVMGQYIADMSSFGWGTVSGKALTLGFWAKAYIAGTFSVSMVAGTVSSYVQDVTITTANTWQFFKLTFPSDPNNAASWNSLVGTAKLAFCFGCGATTFRTPATGAWQAGEFYGSTATTDFGATVSATGIQFAAIKLSTDATGVFTPRPYADELRACQLHHWNTFTAGVAPAQNAGQLGAVEITQLGGAGSLVSATIPFPCAFAACTGGGIPTALSANPSAANAQVRNTVANADCPALTLRIPQGAPNRLEVLFTTAAGSVAGQVNKLHLVVATGK